MSTEIVIFIDTYALYTHTYTLHIHIHIYACSNNEQDTVNLKKKSEIYGRVQRENRLGGRISLCYNLKNKIILVRCVILRPLIRSGK